MCSEAALLTVLALWSVTVVADEPVRDTARLEARPAACIALHRGQECFKRIRLSWTAEAAGRLCLLLDGAAEPLLCWRGGTRTDWVHDYASAEGERYRLVVADAEGGVIETLATASVETAWVYRGGPRGAGAWRLF